MNSTRVIHIFDREGDITEVFDKVRQLKIFIQVESSFSQLNQPIEVSQ
jgi:hypothetical protein